MPITDMSKPTILIVGGAWHPPDYLEPLSKAFEDIGYPTKCVGLPSVGASPPVTDFSGDVKVVRDAATQMISEKRDVIAVLHSIGGIIGCEALHGLGKSQTGGSGVAALIFIASMVPKAGHCFDDHLERLGDDTWKPARAAFTREGMLDLPPDFAQGMFYSELDDDQAKHYTSLLKPQSVGIYDSKLSHETYKEIPSAYMLTARDNAFKHDYQVKTVEFAGFPADKTITLDTGHMPWLTKPDEVIRFVLRIAGQS